MEAIKISVEVSVNLSENTQNFIKSLFGGTVAAVGTQTQKSATTKPRATAAAPAKAKPVTTATSEAPAAEAPAAEATAATPEAPAAAEATAAASKSIEDVRKMLVQKVDAHRDAIKQKLNEFGAPSVTKLDPSKYDEMYNFLNSL